MSEIPAIAFVAARLDESGDHLRPAEVAALRAMLARHVPDLSAYQPETVARLVRFGAARCPVCVVGLDAPDREEWGAAPSPCQVVLDLAAMWPDHPDYAVAVDHFMRGQRPE